MRLNTVCIAALVPTISQMLENPFLIRLFTRVLIFAIVATALNFVLGFGALVSMMHAGLFGVGASIYYLELAAVPFQSLFCLGFGIVSWMSIKHAWLARRRTAAAAAVKPAVASAPAVTVTPTEPVAEAVLAD